MPNIWTHFMFGQQVLKRAGEAKLIADPAMKRVFNMGCQGPDFLFYHHFLPWKKSKTLNKLGEEMHRRSCGPVIMELLETVAGLPAGRDKPDPAVVYALGFVLHHTLDRNVHPYVFSRSGFRKWDHQRFEVLMDTLLVRKRLGLETWRTPVWKEIDTGGAFPEPIVDAFEQIAAVFYPELASRIVREDWNQAYRDMVRAQRLFHDPKGIRRALTFGKIEPFVYKREVPKLDVLNESARPWLDPVDGVSRHGDTFDVMWDRAMRESIPIVTSILKWLRAEQRSGDEQFQKPAHRERAAALIGSRSYETGLPCDSGSRIRYSDPIWPGAQGTADPSGQETSVPG